MKTVYLVRHAHVENPHGILYGRLSGFPLSKFGMKEAKRLSKRFADKKIQAIFSSPLLRTRQTALAIAKETGAPVFFDSKLTERWFAMQGRKLSEKSWLIKQAIKKTGSRPQREAPAEIAKRMQTALRNILARKKLERVVIVSHQDPIDFLLSAAAGKPLTEKGWRPERASVTQLDFENGRLQRRKYFRPACFK